MARVGVMQRISPGQLGIRVWKRRFTVAAYAVFCCTATSCAPPPPTPNPIQTENAQTGDSGWKTADAPQPYVNNSGIEGYADHTGVLPGTTLHFYVRGIAASGDPTLRYRIVVERLGWYGGTGGRQVACLPSCTTDKAAVAQPAPPAPNQYGEVNAGWNVTDTMSVASTWVSGYYMAKLLITNGKNSGTGTYVPFVVLPGANQNPTSILVVVPVNTWQAYNPWGGKDLYPQGTTPAAFKVSLNRPLLNASSGYNRPFYTEYPLVRFLEREGYDVSYVTNYEVDQNPAILQAHRLVIDAGHDEYWTDAQRNGLEAARDAGTNLVFMGADAGYWQVRYEDSGRTIVGYKEHASLDPLQDPAHITSDFRDPPINRPECNLEGVEYGAETPSDTSETYSLVSGASSDPWMANSGFHQGATLPNLAGYEIDRYKSWCNVVSVGTPTMLFHWDDGNGGGADAVRFTAPSGARIFSTGSMQFSWGLDDYGAYQRPSADSRLQQMMRNALSDLTTPAQPASLTPTPQLDHTVKLVANIHPDPRVTTVAIYSHAGQGSFALSDAGVTTVCTQKTFPASCTDSTAAADGNGWIRYEAVTIDRWGVSEPLLSTAVNTATGTYILRAQDQNSSPIPAQLTFTSDVANSTTAAPNSVTVVKAATGSVSAPGSFIANGRTYTFASWSDGGALQHSVTPYGTNLTDDPESITANYVSSDNPPVAQIGSPADGASFTSGEVLTLNGAATDIEDGTEPGSQLHWTVVRNANGQATTLASLTGTAPTLTPDAQGDPSATYVITLTAVDSVGVSSAPVTVTLHALAGNYVLNAVDDQGGNPVAVPLTFTASDGSTDTQPAPNTVNVVKNGPGSVSAPTTFIAGGYTYTFASWSDGGAQQHAVTPYVGGATDDPESLTATYHRSNQPPTATITSPVDGSSFVSGHTVALLGSATDPEDGPLSSGQLAWTVVQHANNTNTTLPAPTGASPSFVADAAGDPNATYTITLIATDSHGAQSAPVTAILHALTGKYVLTAQDSGGSPIAVPLTFSFGGTNLTQPSPNTVNAVKNAQASVSAPTTFTASGSTYTFQSWSDGGAQLHSVTPYGTNLNDDPETLTATYAK